MNIISLTREDRQVLARLTPERVEELRRQSPTPRREVSTAIEVDSPNSPVESAKQKKRARTVVDRTEQWPSVGTIMEGQFLGEVFRAEVVKATKLKSGKALKLLSPPVKGTICRSYSAAQDVVTLAHRQRMGVKGKAGLGPAWTWWRSMSPVGSRPT